MKMLSMREIPRFFAQNEKTTPILSVMVNDQSPGDPKSAYWNTFLNQDTGWMKGAEKLAKKYDQVILFGAIRKKKRGFYEVRSEEHTSELQSRPHLVCRLLLEKK